MQATANVNGTITPAAEAKISILDRSFQYGDSIYEVTRTYQGVPFFFEEHFDRLENSARLARMKITQSRAELTQEILRTVAACGVKPGEDVFIRYTITRGEGALDLDPAVVSRTNFVILVKELPAWKAVYYEKGVRLAIPPTLRNSPLALDPNIKSGNYLNNILAVAEAKEMGADDALLLSLDGKLTEASNSNVAFVIDGAVLTPLHEPRTSTGNLRGLTRTLVGELAAELGLRYEERPLFPSDLSRATECFVSSATREVMPVAEILTATGRHGYPEGGGPVTRRLQEAYANYVKKYVAQRREGAWF